ncbi:MAG TPA: GAF domain-containing protein, partial [Holophagaceae bacterium]|nr:GAF domain-containing protein [Holophagaceae bacterium]
DARFGIDHATVLMLDCQGARLYTVASRGYEASGVGSEIPLGQGVIGVCAREASPIRLGHMASEYAYSRAMREAAEQGGMGGQLETAIPFPGLPGAASQIAVPILGAQGLLGVLFAESREHLRFGYDEEDALVSLGAHLGLAIQDLQAVEPAEALAEVPMQVSPPRSEGRAVVVRYFPENDSVFLDGDYLIKGVAGNIFWVLVQEHAATGRTDFSNRELRLDPRVRLPELGDNLEARLVLLARRLEERGAVARIERTGRGRFRLRVDRPLELVEVPQASGR